jgi:hypothetical protein
MTKYHTKQKAGKLCGILIFTLLLVLIPTFKFDFYYDLNDDTTIKDIISGAYTGTPSGYSIQMLYPLSWLIALFYRAIPKLPWYGLFLCLCQFGVVVLIGWRLLNIMKSKAEQVLSLLILLAVSCGIFVRELVIIQYSVTSAICMVGAVFLFVTSDNRGKASDFIKRNIISILLVMLSFMLRPKMCIMLMPFLLLMGMVKWWYEDKVFTALNFRKYVMLIIVAFIGMLAVYSVDKVAYIGSEWTSFRAFFDARTNLYDFYELPDFEENEDFYNSIGLSRESYTLLENYNFALDESIDSWMLKSISDYQKENAGIANGLSNTFGFVSKNNIKEAIWLYKRHLLSVITGGPLENYLEYIVMFLYIICILLAIFVKQKSKYCVNIVEIILLMFIRSVLWLYLYMVDRVLERVTTPLIMIELCILLLFIMGSIRESVNGKLKLMICASILALPVLLMVVSWNNLSTEMNMRVEADKRWNALMDYCANNESNYYVIDVYSSTSYNGASYSEKMFKNVDNSYKNYDICGGWTAKSPLMRQKLSVMGLKYIQSALYIQKAYFIAACDKDLTWLTSYYQNRGYDVAPNCVDTIYTQSGEAAFMVYRIEGRQ